MIDTDVIHVTVDRGHHRLLVVDDNATTRYSTGRVLRAAGFQVEEAASGSEALERASSGVSGVVLDVHLPDMDGFEVCRRLRTDPETEHLPVIHLSATHVQNEDRVEGLNAGADAYMVHPVEPAVLVATVQALIRARTAEERMHGSERRFRAIYNHAVSGIGLLDVHGRFTEANPALLRLLGCSFEELRGATLTELAPAGWRDSVADRVRDLALTPQPWLGEFPLVTKDGRVLHLEWSVSEPIGDGLRVAIANDASERHELEIRRAELLEREQAARGMAEQHIRTKDDFIAVLSHELRNPLNSIVGWTAVLMRRQPTPEMRKGLEAIERSVKTQARIISDILDVSRINSGKLRLEMEDADPNELIANAIGAMQAGANEKSLTIEQDLRAHGPAWLDPARFQQIFWNLMANAIKFSSRGGTVYVTLRSAGDRLRLTVRDEGQGIKPDFLPQLFERFTQSDAPGNRAQGGLGLGLAIVRHLADLHGGTVRAESAGPGLGASFTVDIAATRTPLASDSGDNSLPAHEPDTTGQPLRGLEILVVDDDAGAAEMLAMVLSDRGARVRTAVDYDSAVQAAREQWPAVLVSDIGLPGRDGYELIRKIRDMDPAGHRPGVRLPAVALTAFARPEDRRKALDAGFDSHLAKPLRPHQLVSAILDTVSPRRSDT